MAWAARFWSSTTSIDLLWGILCELYEELDLPDLCKAAFHTCDWGQDCDRWLIYTDGSSGGGPRWKIPDRPGDEHPVVDAWAFLVVGETYAPAPGKPQFTLIGWLAHPVLYEPDCVHHIGGLRLGAEVAEREALFWAGLWRLGQNSLKPTVFRPDSLTAGLQAFGQCGAARHDQSFQLLRGVFQTLQSFLPGDQLLLRHVVSHCQDPFNEFVDYVANQERRKSYYTSNDNESPFPPLLHWSLLLGCTLISKQGYLLYARMDSRHLRRRCQHLAAAKEITFADLPRLLSSSLPVHLSTWPRSARHQMGTAESWITFEGNSKHMGYTLQAFKSPVPKLAAPRLTKCSVFLQDIVTSKVESNFGWI